MAGETAKELIESLDNEEAAMLQSNVGNNSPRNPTRQPEGLTVGHDNSTIVSSSSRVKTTSAATHADTIAKAMQNQNNSFFPDNLPPEIRSRILDLVLGSRVVHIEERLAYRSNHMELCHSVCLRPKSFSNEYENFKAGRGSTEEDSNHERHNKCYSVSKGAGYPRSDQKLRLAVFRVCRQVYNECLPVLFATNTFSFSRPWSFKAFMSILPLAHRRLLASINLDLTDDIARSLDPALTLEIVRSLEGLKSFHVRSEHAIRSEYLPNRENSAFNLQFAVMFLKPVLKFGILPLEQVTIIITNALITKDRDNKSVELPQTLRLNIATYVEKLLINPNRDTLFEMQ